MHTGTIKITPNLLFEYQCTSGKFIRLPNRIESKLFFARIGMLYSKDHGCYIDVVSCVGCASVSEINESFIRRAPHSSLLPGSRL